MKFVDFKLINFKIDLQLQNFPVSFVNDPRYLLKLRYVTGIFNYFGGKKYVQKRGIFNLKFQKTGLNLLCSVYNFFKDKFAF